MMAACTVRELNPSMYACWSGTYLGLAPTEKVIDNLWLERNEGEGVGLFDWI